MTGGREAQPSERGAEPPYEAALANTTPEESYLRALREETEQALSSPQMLSGPVVGRLLEFLVWALQPQLILEIGTYSGYSALSMGRALPPGGRIITCEADPERAAFARRHIERHGRISVREGDALATIASLDGPFDMVFIDANKDGYVDYYEAVLPKLAPRGLMVADNTLGEMAGIAEFNEHVRNDQRTVQVLVPVRDGVTLIRRV
ncbi:MAG: O-methyltransferase [Actinomycetota bacterium]|nr:O-methyltransferase [Actinomycetota bacterium]MDQ5807440.1 O-methyltransferase [Actinomycetota bacterium]